jgi:hypothetical protein
MRIWVLTCSTRALDSPCSIAATIPARWAVIVRASLTNDPSRHRRAHAIHSSSSRVGGQPVDLSELLFE